MFSQKNIKTIGIVRINCDIRHWQSFFVGNYGDCAKLIIFPSAIHVGINNLLGNYQAWFPSIQKQISSRCYMV